jgi:DNA-binding SARP family transcriptional activator
MSILHIKLLGGFSVTLDDSPVAGLHQPRLQSLLAYLLLNRHAPQFETVLSVPVLARFD